MKSNWFLRSILLIFSFAFVGGLASALLAPTLITWYAEPAVDMGFNCASTAAWATRTLLQWQLWGAISAVALGLIATLLITRKTRKKLENA